MSDALEAMTDAIEGQNLYHGRHGTTPAGEATARAILSCLRNHHRLELLALREFGAAWDEAVAALGPNQRLVLWTDGGPEWVQVLEPEPPHCEHESEDTMRPKLSRLAAYPSKGLGDLADTLREVAATLREPAP